MLFLHLQYGGPVGSWANLTLTSDIFILNLIRFKDNIYKIIRLSFTDIKLYCKKMNEIFRKQLII